MAGDNSGRFISRGESETFESLDVPVAAVDLGELPRKFGRYEILERIGSGGMGTVFRARQIQMDRIVALKLLSPELAGAEQYVRRFVREARSAGSLNHANIVQVHDVARIEGHPFICMEYIDGTTVGKLIRETGHLSIKKCLQVALAVASALDEAHNRGIIHRDVKPDNILIDNTGRVKLADLGLARGGNYEGSETITTAGFGLGTPHYVAIEQARDGRRADPRSDIYSLGATLYHMTTGAPPFNGQNPLDILMSAAEKQCPSPLMQNENIPESFSRIIMRMMARNPKERYQTAALLIKDLKQLEREIAGLGPAMLQEFKPVKEPESLGAMLLSLAVGAALLFVTVVMAMLLAPAPPQKSTPIATFQYTPLKKNLINEEVQKTDSKIADMQNTDSKTTDAQVADSKNTNTQNVATKPIKPPAIPPKENPTSTEDASRPLSDILREISWFERGGEYGRAVEILNKYLASATKERKIYLENQKALLLTHARQNAEQVFRRAREFTAQGRDHSAARLLELAATSWGLPILEKRAMETHAQLKSGMEERIKKRAEIENFRNEIEREVSSANALLRRREFKPAQVSINVTLKKLKANNAPNALLQKVVAKNKSVDARAYAHEKMIERINSASPKIRAEVVLDNMPNGAYLKEATSHKLVIAINPESHWERSWASLSARQYAYILDFTTNKKNAKELLAVALSLFEAGNTRRALALWKALPGEGLSIDQNDNTEQDTEIAIAAAMAKAIELSEQGHTKDAIFVLSELLLLAENTSYAKEFPALLKALYSEAQISMGLPVNFLLGIGEEIEFTSDFRADRWQDGFTLSAGLCRNSNNGIVSPAGGMCTFTFEVPFVSMVELNCVASFFEDTASGIEAVWLSRDDDSKHSGSAWISSSDLKKNDLEQKLVEIIFKRNWTGIQTALRHPPTPQVRAKKVRTGEVKIRVPGAGERVAITLVGWCELRRVQIRGAVDPQWWAKVKSTRTEQANKELNKIMAIQDEQKRLSELEPFIREYIEIPLVGQKAMRAAIELNRKLDSSARAKQLEAIFNVLYTGRSVTKEKGDE